MSGYILCQVERTRQPYYIESISMNIYSMEELCYFLSNNLYLLDETILNRQLCQWLKNELGLGKLSAKIYPYIQDGASTGEIIFPILKEFNYLNAEEIKLLNQNLEKMEEESEAVKMRKRGDCLVTHGKYAEAILAYQNLLLSEDTRELNTRFQGYLYNNMGCAYIRMFQGEEAAHCFWKAYEKLHSAEILKSYLFAYFMCNTQKDYDEQIKQLHVDEKTATEVQKEIETAMIEAYESPEGKQYETMLIKKKQEDKESYQKALDEFIGRLTREYHRNTGL